MSCDDENDQLTSGICNKDATVQCTDCDGELYCGACWKEHHEEDPDHRGKKFVWNKPRPQAL